MERIVHLRDRHHSRARAETKLAHAHLIVSAKDDVIGIRDFALTQLAAQRRPYDHLIRDDLVATDRVRYGYAGFILKFFDYTVRRASRTREEILRSLFCFVSTGRGLKIVSGTKFVKVV